MKPTKKRDPQLITFRLAPSKQELIDELVKDGRYMNRSDFFRTAVDNQLTKENIVFDSIQNRG